MKYFLKLNILGFSPEVQISESEYSDLKKARVSLLNGLSIEEKYEILISNYFDFETEMAVQATNFMIRQHRDHDDFFKSRVNFNIKLVNLLTAARLYVDQLAHHAKKILPNSETIKEEIKKFFAEEYDNNLAYRFMEALRNYVQHRGIPVHITQYSASRENIEDGNQIVYSTEIYSEKRFLDEDGFFKKKVIEEIPDKINLKEMTRSYIESLSKVHCLTVRSRMIPNLFMEKVRF